jgi:hypothetical protein
MVSMEIPIEQYDKFRMAMFPISGTNKPATNDDVSCLLRARVRDFIIAQFAGPATIVYPADKPKTTARGPAPKAD